jgi:hypothetical protein
LEGRVTEERRTDERFLLSVYTGNLKNWKKLYFEVFRQGQEKPIGVLADISDRGFSLIGSSSFETDESFILRIMLPEAIGGRDYIELRARSCWSRPDNDTGLIHTGFHILAIPAPNDRAWEMLLSITAELGRRKQSRRP